MAPDEELVLIFASLHLAALVLGGLLFALFVRSRPRPDSRGHEDEDEGGGGGGGNDRLGNRPKTSPPGGIPLPDADPAPVRLRGHERLRDLRPEPLRRPAEHPQPGRRRVPAP